MGWFFATFSKSGGQESASTCREASGVSLGWIFSKLQATAMISRFFYKISPRGQMDCLDFQGDWPLLEHSVGKRWGLGKHSNFWIWVFGYHLKTHCCSSSMSWVYEYHKHLFSAATYGLGVLIHPCLWQRWLTVYKVVYLMRSVDGQGYILQDHQSLSPNTTFSNRPYGHLTCSGSLVDCFVVS